MSAPNVLFIAQAGRLAYEAVILAASFRLSDPAFPGRLIAAEPQPGPLWPGDPRIPADVRTVLDRFGVEVVPFDNRAFGHRYPQGNKIEALNVLPGGEPFVFFDTDTLFTGPLSQVAFDFARPSASMRREPTWPEPPPYGPGYEAIWKSLYDRFGLDFTTSLDLSHPAGHWERYLYFNAGWFFGPCPRRFGERLLAFAQEIERNPPEELAAQALTPWLDQIALPLAIHDLGGRRPGPELAGLDGEVSCHYRALPLLYARESDRAVAVLEAAVAPNPVKKVMKAHEPAKRLIYQGKGRQVRALFDRDRLPLREQPIRALIKAEGLWWR